MFTSVAPHAAPRHAGTVDVIDYDHGHLTVDALLDCTDNLCVAILEPANTSVEYVGKHGVRYARGNN